MFTFRVDLADLLYIVPCAVVDGLRDSSLANDLMLTGWSGSKDGDILHSLTELSSSDPHSSCNGQNTEYSVY